MRRLSHQRGDTIVEVILAFAIFALLAVGTTVAMNRGLAMGQQSLERTLVRQQVDAQAELLRYARDAGGATWDDIVSHTVPSPNLDSFSSCPASPTDMAGSFVMNIVGSGPSASLTRVALSGGNYTPAGYHSRVELKGGSGVIAEGLWVQAVEVAGSGNAYDMYIRACWDSISTSKPLQVSTIVRLYES